MGKKAPKVDVPDPMEIIRAEQQANRFNTSGPFGSTQWQGNMQVTNLSPEMQAMQDRMFQLGMQDSERVELPSYITDIASGVMGRIGQRYGAPEKPAPSQQIPPPNLGPMQPDTLPVMTPNPGAPPPSMGNFQAMPGFQDMPGLNQQINFPDLLANGGFRNLLQER